MRAARGFGSVGYFLAKFSPESQNIALGAADGSGYPLAAFHHSHRTRVDGPAADESARRLGFRATEGNAIAVYGHLRRGAIGCLRRRRKDA